MDPATGQSRGFGFILFHNEASIEAVLAAGNHEIDGKTVSYSILIDLDRGVGCLLLIILLFWVVYYRLFQVDPKKAERRDGKMFVGGVKAETTDDIIKG